MSAPSLSEYRAALAEHFPLAFYRDRRFEKPDEWDRLSGFRGGWLAEYQPDLASVLKHRALVVLGEPGSGKSTVAKAAIPLAFSNAWVPLFASLRSYDTDLLACCRGPLPADAIDKAKTRLFILDGFDEIPTERIDKFVDEVLQFADSDPRARFVLTSRQAFFVSRRTRLADQWPAMYIVDLTSDDIDAFVKNAGIDRTAFGAKIQDAGLGSEIHNPFVLTAVLARLAATGHISSSRSEAVRHLIDKMLTERPTSSPAIERRALKMLAVAMETYAHNELTEEQCVTVLRRSIEISETEATKILAELTESILIRSGKGFAFQMRSYGEYLAAEELHETRRDLDQVLSLMWEGGTQRPSESWRNSASFLVELNGRARRHFIRRWPDWTLPATPGCFSGEQRRTVVNSVLEELRSRHEFLLQHPVIRARDLARFVVPAGIVDLSTQLTSNDDVVVANAILILGLVGDSSRADDILALGLDPTKHLWVRYSALVAIEHVGRPNMVQPLLAIDDWEHPTVSSRLDAAAAVMDMTDVGAVLSALCKKSKTVHSAAYERFGRIRTDQEIEAVLSAVDVLGCDCDLERMATYLGPFWKEVIELWQPKWAQDVARLLQHPMHAPGSNAARELLKILRRNETAASQIAAALVDRIRTDASPLDRLDYHAFELPNIGTVTDILRAEPQLLSFFRAFGRPEVQQSLRPKGSSEPSEEPPALAKLRLEQEEHFKSVERAAQAAATGTSGLAILVELGKLEVRHWPDLGPTQISLLQSAVDERLVALDLRNSIKWIAPHRYTQPGVLPLLLELTERYNLCLTDDRPLAWALLGFATDKVAKYHSRRALSAKAWDEINTLLQDDAVTDEALDQVVHFIARTLPQDTRFKAALTAIACGSRSDRLRGSALYALIRLRPDPNDLAALRTRIGNALIGDLERALLGARHRPTIERRLRQLLEDPSLLDAGEQESGFENQVSWIGQIQEAWAWKKLSKLRQLALTRQLPQVAGTITHALSSISKTHAAKLILRQLPGTPPDWRDVQRARARQLQYEASIAKAHDLPFDKVIQRMRRTTSMSLVRVWVEGPTDVPAVQELFDKLPDDLGGNVLVNSLGGWAQVLSSAWSPRGLSAGSHEALVLFDGDRARDFSTSGFPMKPDAEVRAALAKLDEASIEYVVLHRYALENYFPEHAYVAVCGSSAVQAFPLDPGKAVIDQVPGYAKDRNVDLAARTTLLDLSITDLGAFIADIGRRVSH